MFRTSADYDEVNRLRDERKQLESDLRGVGGDREQFDAINARIADLSASEEQLVRSAAEAGIEIEQQAAAVAAAASETLTAESLTAIGDSLENITRKSLTELNELLAVLEALADYASKNLSNDKRLLNLGFSQKDLDALKDSPEKLKKLQTAIAKVKTETANRGPLRNFFNTLEEGFKSISKGDKGSLASGFSQIGKAVDGFMPTIKELKTSLTDAVGSSNEMLGPKMDNASNKLEGVGEIASGAGKAMSGDYLGAAISVVSGISKFFNNDDVLEKEIQLLNRQFENLRWNYDNFEAAKIDKALDGTTKLFENLSRVITDNFLKSHNLSSFFASLAPTLWKNQSAINAIAGAYSKLGYSVDKYIGEEKYDSSRERLESLAKQQALVYTQMEKEEQKKKSDKDRINKYKQQLQEIGAEMVSLVNDMVEEIIGGSSETIASDLGDAFFEAFRKGEDAAAAWGDKVNDIIADMMKRMIIQKFLSEPMAKLFDEYKQAWFPNGVYAGSDALLADMPKLKDKFIDAYRNFTNLVNTLPEEVLDLIMETGKSSADAASKGFQTMSQETGDELNGRFTDIQARTRDIYAVLAEMFGRRNEESYLAQLQIRDIAAETRAYIVDSYLQLVQISGNTKAVIAPIRNMSDKLSRISLKIMEM